MSIKIISGAQTGADIAGLWSAKLFGIKTGGWAPKRYMTLDGPHPEMAATFDIKEHVAGYHDRTIQNLKQSNVTLIFSEKMSPGTRLTISQCKKYNVDHFIFPLDPMNMEESLKPGEPLTNFYFDYVIEKLKSQISVYEMCEFEEPFTINIAGNSTNNSARIFEFTFKLCFKLFTGLGFKTEASSSDWYKYKDRFDNR